MSEEIKYEPVFGDQSLFDNAPLAELVSHSGGFYKNSPDGPIYCGGCTFTTDEYRNIGFIAARRVIRTPTWTVADQKAGRLPEVGSLVMAAEVETKNNIFEFAGVCAGSKRFAVKDIDDGLLYFYSKEMIVPIETPDEKDLRLREKWCAKAVGVCGLGMLGITTLTRIYDALLSGELTIPSKDGE